MKKIILLASLLPLLAAAPVKKTASVYEVKTVVVAPYSGVITPAAAEFISGAVARVNAPGGADLLVIALDTPGGLDTSMREIIKAMLASKKPMSPRRARGRPRPASSSPWLPRWWAWRLAPISARRIRW